MDRDIKRMVNQVASRLSRRDFERYQAQLSAEVRRRLAAGQTAEQVATYLDATLAGIA